MKAAKIIVTANPGNWEGDFRCVVDKGGGELLYAKYVCWWGVYDPCCIHTRARRTMDFKKKIKPFHPSLSPALNPPASRLWEAMGSKALVLVDRMYVELPHALLDREDVVYFDSLDKSSLVDTVRYYLEHEEEARRIAMNGFYKVQRGRGYWVSEPWLVCGRP